MGFTIFVRMKSEVTIDISVDEFEKKAVSFLAQGLSVPEIGKEIKKESRYIEYRLGKLKTRLQCTTASQLVAFFLRNKLID